MIYLDNGATSFPKPKGMVYAMEKCITEYCGNPGRSGHFMSMKAAEEVYKTRKAIGRIFHIEDCSRILFTLNATEALNMAIKGVLREGDHAITTVMEHNSVLRPLIALERRGVENTIVNCCSDGLLDMDNFKRGIRANTKLIVCTHASNVTGGIMPIEELGKLAKERNILFLVDAAQSAGTVEIDVDKMNIDMLAVPGHKGLLGPLGTGILYVRNGITLGHLKEGGTGTLSKDLYQPVDFPEGYEAGTVNVPGIVGLGYSANFVHRTGIEKIRNYEEGLVRILDDGIRSIKKATVYGPGDCRRKTGIVTFNLEGLSCEEVCDKLNEKFNIGCRGGYHCAGFAHKAIGTWDTGAVRMSVGPFNTQNEVKSAVEAVYRISKF